MCFYIGSLVLVSASRYVALCISLCAACMLYILDMENFSQGVDTGYTVAWRHMWIWRTHDAWSTQLLAFGVCITGLGRYTILYTYNVQNLLNSKLPDPLIKFFSN